ncbi:putative glycoside hydrolase [Vaginisenegalia massiliensis]|uniref:putative glycoside hydrolase n=1 Tax=Vaginisenegalia massiliensis TaxID=2058294 RepID=UPI001F15481F|nr:putative glycoside hydrolase [Vaginisenegalia massiliensis]
MQLLVLSFTFLLISACGLSKEAKMTPLPKIKDKYKSEVIADFNNRVTKKQTNKYENLVIRNKPVLTKPGNLPSSLFYDSGIEIAYPQDGVKGIYLTADNVADPTTFNDAIDYINQTDLNTVVIDFKDDSGNVTTPLKTNDSDIKNSINPIVDLKDTMKVLEKNQIYPIARIVTFKDTHFADKHPEYSFISKETGQVWQNEQGAKFINPFLKQVWDYDIKIAIEAAKMGFKEIQFDYVRFPEGFHDLSDTLSYSKGDYENYVGTDEDKIGEERVAAVTDFLKYARERLAPYGVKVSADVFGYTAVAGDKPDVRGIGQNFAMMAEQVDVISSMVYPSHWGPGFFGIPHTDLQPFDTIDEYMYSEESALAGVKNNVISRPWLQDFTDSSLPVGTYQHYGPKQVQEQINALHKHGIHEFLLWNVDGRYTHGVDYKPESNQ